MLDTIRASLTGVGEFVAAQYEAERETAKSTLK